MGDVHTALAYICCCCLCGNNDTSTPRRSSFGTKKAPAENAVDAEMASLDYTQDANGRFSRLKSSGSAGLPTKSQLPNVTEEPKPTIGLPAVDDMRPDVPPVS